MNYNYAARYIRLRVINQITMANNAKTNYTREERLNLAEGLMQALSVILSTESNIDASEPAGIAEIETLAETSVETAREYLGARWVQLGFANESSS